MKILVLVSIILLMSQSGFSYWDESCNFSSTTIPEKSGDIKDFVPKGYSIKNEYAGPIYRSEGEGKVILLEKHGDQTGKVVEGILILREVNPDLYELDFASCKILANGGMMLYGSEVNLIKDVLIIRSSYGSRSMYDTTLKIRYEPKEQEFMLIGKDEIIFDRLEGKTEKNTSVNYLTGDLIIDGKKSKSAPQKIFFRDINYAGESVK